MKEAAVRVVFEDRRNNIQHEWEGEYGGVMLKDDDGLACLFAGDVSKKNILAAMAAFVDNIIGGITGTEEERQTYGIIFVKMLGKMMAGEDRPEPEIRIDGWKAAEERKPRRRNANMKERNT